MTRTPPEEQKKGGVAAVERALSIVAAVEAAANPIGLADLARATGLYKSTILRLLVTLEGAGYIARLVDGSYDLGLAAFRLGAAFERKTTLHHYVLPALQALVDLGSESASFHVRQDHERRLCLFRVDSHHATLDRVEAGGSYPLQVGAAGRIITAFDADGAADDALRGRGWALSLGERDPSCAAVAAPVFGPSGRLLGAISLSGPRERFGTDDIARMTQALLPAAERLTRSLGGVWPGFATEPPPRNVAPPRP